MARSNVSKFMITSDLFPKAIFNRGQASKHLIFEC
jgi:hypothetical protein